MLLDFWNAVRKSANPPDGEIAEAWSTAIQNFKLILPVWILHWDYWYIKETQKNQD